MATTEQIDANRQNAQHSTGPRTPEGKAASRFNALKSGIDAQAQIITGEDPANLDALVAEYQQRFDTSAPECRMLVDTLISCEWLFRRLNRAEASLWQYTIMDTQNRLSSNDHALGRVLDRRNEKFDRLQRRINSIQRNYLRALKELQNIEKTQSAAGQVGQALPPAIPDAVPVPIQPQSNQQPNSEIGFVPTNAPPPAPSPRPLAPNPRPLAPGPQFR
jgi:ABC-type transporter Mla subunit MlaD